MDIELSADAEERAEERLGERFDSSLSLMQIYVNCQQLGRNNI